jgi:Protein of unknown function (DUF1113).
MGLQWSAISVNGTDLYSFCSLIFRIMRSGNLSRKLSDAFFIRRKNSSFSCIV